MRKLIITAALTGSLPTKEQNPNVPITPDEIAQDALACYNAGATPAMPRGRTAMTPQYSKRSTTRLRPWHPNSLSSCPQGAAPV